MLINRKKLPLKIVNKVIIYFIILCWSRNFYNIFRYFSIVWCEIFDYDLYVFQFEQIFRHFWAPATELGPGAAYPLSSALMLGPMDQRNQDDAQWSKEQRTKRNSRVGL